MLGVVGIGWMWEALVLTDAVSQCAVGAEQVLRCGYGGMELYCLIVLVFFGRFWFLEGVFDVERWVRVGGL